MVTDGGISLEYVAGCLGFSAIKIRFVMNTRTTTRNPRVFNRVGGAIILNKTAILRLSNNGNERTLMEQ